MKRLAIAFTVAAISGAALLAQDRGQGQVPTPYPLANPIRERGSSVTGAFEGWYYNKDGSVSLLVGYFNRNTKQELDIPVGPNNRIEPGGPDQGQPTHFQTGRQFGVFSIKIPKDFGGNRGDKELTWTLIVNGQTNVITMHTRNDWIVSPFEDPANKNTPPSIRFQPGGPAFQGPPNGVAASLDAVVGEALPLTVYASDEGPKVNVEPPAPSRNGRGRGAFGPPPLAVSWSLMRGPAAVKFENAKPSIDKENGGKTTTSAYFGVPGEYILRVQGNDSTGEGGGGFQCCWTNAHVRVTVKPANTGNNF
jgi:hypothetical protein